MATLPIPTRYISDENGRTISVVLDYEVYQQWQDPDLLLGLSTDDLEILAEGMLSSQHQTRLSELLTKNKGGILTDEETAELDALLERIDQMNILKARARYTLQKIQ